MRKNNKHTNLPYTAFVKQTCDNINVTKHIKHIKHTNIPYIPLVSIHFTLDTEVTIDDESLD